MTKVLVVDDEQGIREMLEIYLQREGYEVTCASDGETALSCCMKTFFDIVVTDIKMPGMGGMSLLHKVKEISPDTIFIMITAFASFETAKESMEEDAYDYITKPFDVEEITKKIESALKKRKQLVEERLKDVTDKTFFSHMIGESKAMERVFDLIVRSASSKSNVLITGESGTGKQLVAQAIHDHSARSSMPFVTINCGGIPENLLESELFGYKKGAFTGALKDKKGLAEMSRGGTLFLDEAGELPPPLQVKLLRMVQEKAFTPVGGTEELKADIRIISATNQNLEKKVMEGTFREDLYYRLNVINIVIPPLRERKEDIPLLANCFLDNFSRELGKEITEISSYAMECLVNYQFPGNVRELENIIERSVALAKTSIMLPDSLELSRFKTDDQQKGEGRSEPDFSIPPEGISLDDILTGYEKRYMEAALKTSKGSIKGAAKLLGISFRSIRYRLEKLNIDVKQFK